MSDIKKAVVANKADLGIAFDGDSDRIGVIDSDGNSMTGDKLLLIYAEDVIKEYNEKGIKPVIVSEVKCSQVLYDTINQMGGKAIMNIAGIACGECRIPVVPFLPEEYRELEKEIEELNMLDYATVSRPVRPGQVVNGRA